MIPADKVREIIKKHEILKRNYPLEQLKNYLHLNQKNIQN